MNSPNQDKPTFKPWRDDFKYASVFLSISVASCYVGARVIYNHWGETASSDLPLIIGGTSILAGLVLWRLSINLAKQGLFRLNGVKVEKNAIKNLQSLLPTGWGLRTGVMTTAGGDIDVILTNGESSLSFSVEIKSAKTTWGMDSFFRRLFGIGIDSRAKSAIAQAKRNADFIPLGATPILWLPLTKRFNATFKNVLVIGGDAKYFMGVIKKI